MSTQPDLLEEVVAEMQDEFGVDEKSNQWIRKLGEQGCTVSARIEPNTLLKKLGVGTVGG